MYDKKDLTKDGKHDYDEKRVPEEWMGSFSINIFRWELDPNKNQLKKIKMRSESLWK